MTNCPNCISTNFEIMESLPTKIWYGCMKCTYIWVEYKNNGLEIMHKYIVEIFDDLKSISTSSKEVME